MFRMLHYRGKTYLFALNPTDNPVRLHFGGRGGRMPITAKVLFEDRRVTFNVRGFREKLDPLAVHIYEIEEQISELNVTAGNRAGGGR